MATVWTLRVRGKLRTRITLHDEQGELARLTTGGWPNDERWCRATDRDGVEWNVVVDAFRMELRRGDDVLLRADGERLRVGDRILTWTVRTDGSRRASAVTHDGRSMLEVGSTDCRAPDWAELRIDDLLPEPFAVALATAAKLIITDGQARGSDGVPPAGGGGQ